MQPPNFSIPSLHASLRLARTHPAAAAWLFSQDRPPLPPSAFTLSLATSLQQEVCSTTLGSAAPSRPLAYGTTVDQLLVPAAREGPVTNGFVFAVGRKHADVDAAAGRRRVSRKHELRARFAYDEATRDFLMVQCSAAGRATVGVMDFRCVGEGLVQKAIFTVPADECRDDDACMRLPTRCSRAHCALMERDSSERVDYEIEVSFPTEAESHALSTNGRSASRSADGVCVTLDEDFLGDGCPLQTEQAINMILDSPEGSAPFENLDEQFIHDLLRDITRSQLDQDLVLPSHASVNSAANLCTSRSSSPAIRSETDVLRDSMGALERTVKGSFFSLGSFEHLVSTAGPTTFTRCLGREMTIIGTVDRLVVGEVRTAAASMYYSESLSVRIDEKLQLAVRKRVAAWRCEQRRKLRWKADERELRSLQRVRDMLGQRLLEVRKENVMLRTRAGLVNSRL